MNCGAGRITAEGAWSWLLAMSAVMWQLSTMAAIAVLVATRLDDTRLLDYLFIIPAVLAGLSRRRYWVVGTGSGLGVLCTAAAVSAHHGADVVLLAVGALAYTVIGLIVQALVSEVVQAREMLTSALSAVAKALHYRDSYTLRHAELAASLARETAVELGMGRGAVKGVHVAAILHDVGKIGIPDSILSKPGPLEPQEYAVIQKHPEIGYEIVRSIDGTEPIAQAILHHHERWDGAGYPKGLSGEAIPLEARIIAVTDAYEAMVDDRVYRRGIAREQALEELERCAGTQFDPRVVRAFLTVASR